MVGRHVTILKPLWWEHMSTKKQPKMSQVLVRIGEKFTGIYGNTEYLMTSCWLPGLEWDTVFLVQCNETTMPLQRSNGEFDVHVTCDLPSTVPDQVSWHRYWKYMYVSRVLYFLSCRQGLPLEDEQLEEERRQLGSRTEIVSRLFVLLWTLTDEHFWHRFTAIWKL